MTRPLFKNFERLASFNNFIFQREGKKFTLTTNCKNLGAGATSVFDSLNEACPEMTEIYNGISPLNGVKFTPYGKV